jgi:hypothetical protein
VGCAKKTEAIWSDAVAVYANRIARKTLKDRFIMSNY